MGGVCKEKGSAMAKILTILKQAGLIYASRAISIPKIVVGGLGIVVNGFAKLELGACTIEERRVSELLAPPDFRFAILKVLTLENM